MRLDIITIVIIALAIAGIVWFFPKMPRLAQIIVAIVMVIACVVILLNVAGIPVFR